MNEIDSIKNTLIDELWLPIVREGSSILYPRLRKNKKMKVFTLTNDRNYQEIDKLLENKITEKDRIIAWSYSFRKNYRLETSTGCMVKGGCRYEESADITSTLQNYLPFDVVNLDFSSQDPIPENDRIKKEIKSLEETVRLQRHQNKNGFILIYTTVLNSYPIDKGQIVNCIQLGLNLSDFHTTIMEQTQKMNFIETMLKRIFSKYDYQIHEIDKRNYEFSNSQKIIFSIAGIVREGA